MNWSLSRQILTSRNGTQERTKWFWLECRTWNLNLVAFYFPVYSFPHNTSTVAAPRPRHTLHYFWNMGFGCIIYHEQFHKRRLTFVNLTLLQLWKNKSLFIKFFSGWKFTFSAKNFWNMGFGCIIYHDNFRKRGHTFVNLTLLQL